MTNQFEEFLFFDHPSGLARIHMAMRWQAEHLDEMEPVAVPDPATRPDPLQPFGGAERLHPRDDDNAGYPGRSGDSMKPAFGASSDNELLDRCRLGDPEAFGAIYDRYGNILYGTALRLLRRPTQAEDVVQEAFMKLHTRPPAPPVKNLGGWLHRVTTHAALDRLRRRQRRAEQALPDAPMPAPRPGAGASASADIESAVQQLPERGRQVFMLHDVEGFQHNEIATLLGISSGTSKSQLFRARRRLRDLLSPGNTPTQKAGP